VAGLEQGVADEGRLGLVRLGHAQGPGGQHLEAAVQQGVQFLGLAGVVRRRDELKSSFQLQRHDRLLSGTITMQLLYSPMSPFARKVRVVAHELGLADAITLEIANPYSDESVRTINPL
jgi:hypothetical protein